jgi:hypothetical protein
MILFAQGQKFRTRAGYSKVINPQFHKIDHLQNNIVPSDRTLLSSDFSVHRGLGKKLIFGGRSILIQHIEEGNEKRGPSGTEPDEQPGWTLYDQG